jgi:hypothetical protein
MSEPRPISEEFSEHSRKSIWALVQDTAAIGEVLRKELPYDSLTATWHNEDGTDDFTIGICGRMGETLHFLTIYTHYFDAPPEPKEMYPPNCCAIGTLEISSSEPLPREAFEVCGTPDRWMVHHNDKWVPLSASMFAFLLGINQKLPDAP